MFTLPGEVEEVLRSPASFRSLAAAARLALPAINSDAVEISANVAMRMASLKQHPLLWHLRAGGGAAHSIKSGREHAQQRLARLRHHSVTSSARASSVDGTVRLSDAPYPNCRLDLGSGSFSYGRPTDYRLNGGKGQNGRGPRRGDLGGWRW
jgi:hypothetical protein